MNEFDTHDDDDETGESEEAGPVEPIEGQEELATGESDGGDGDGVQTIAESPAEPGADAAGDDDAEPDAAGPEDDPNAPIEGGPVEDDGEQSDDAENEETPAAPAVAGGGFQATYDREESTKADAEPEAEETPEA